MANFSSFREWFLPNLRKNLSKELVYHGVHHTLEVLDNTAEILLNLKQDTQEIKLLNTAVLLHDSGFMNGYEHHEDESCNIAETILPEYNYTQEEIHAVCGMIMATKIPQEPKNELEKIIADADLMYLGTNKYDEISLTLYQELVFHSKLKNERDWLLVQISFLEGHHFHTTYCKDKYSKKKQENLIKLKRLL